jgi:hypothetical protein
VLLELRGFRDLEWGLFDHGEDVLIRLSNQWIEVLVDVGFEDCGTYVFLVYCFAEVGPVGIFALHPRMTCRIDSVSGLLRLTCSGGIIRTCLSYL